MEVVQLLSPGWRSGYCYTSPRRGEVGRVSDRVGPSSLTLHFAFFTFHFALLHGSRRALRNFLKQRTRPSLFVSKRRCLFREQRHSHIARCGIRSPQTEQVMQSEKCKMQSEKWQDPIALSGPDGPTLPLGVLQGF